jgi:hypothetical protein
LPLGLLGRSLLLLLLDIGLIWKQNSTITGGCNQKVGSILTYSPASQTPCTRRKFGCILAHASGCGACMRFSWSFSAVGHTESLPTPLGRTMGSTWSLGAA